MRARVALITGASSGIGAELARLFAADGRRLALVARRADRLAAIATEILASGGEPPIVIVCDLAAPDATDTIAKALEAAHAEPEFVVNNAGFGLFGEAAAHDIASQLAMIDVNIRALSELSLRFADALIRNKGGILNVGSVAGFLPGPNMAVYYATKAYVLSFSEALHEELRLRGVRVTALCPGPVPTEFQERAGLASRHERWVPAQSARAVARAGYRGLMAGKRVVVPGLANKMVIFAVRWLPRGLVLRAVGLAQRHR